MLHFFVLFQLLPLPHWVTRIFSPVSASLYSSAAQAVGLPAAFHPLSVNSFLTLSKLLEYVAYFMIFVVVVNASPSRTFYRFILVVFIVSAGFQGIYGLIEFFSGHQHIFSYNKIVNREYATGTFINRNHFAAFLEICIPVLFALMADHVESLPKTKGNFLARLSRSLEGEGGKILIYLFLIASLWVAVIFSLSRGGVLFCFLSSIVFFLLYRRVKHGSFQSLIWVLVIAIFLGGMIWYTAEPLATRFGKISTEFTAERSRLQIYYHTFLIFLDFPASGSGAGTFMEVFPMYRGSVSGGFFRYAHNDYLQLLAEAGIVGCVVLLALLWMGWKRISGIIARPFGPNTILLTGIFCGLMSCALHSLTEFGLQIPAVAMTFTILAGLFWRTPSGENSIL